MYFGEGLCRGLGSGASWWNLKCLNCVFCCDPRRDCRSHDRTHDIRAVLAAMLSFSWSGRRHRGCARRSEEPGGSSSSCRGARAQAAAHGSSPLCTHSGYAKQPSVVRTTIRNPSRSTASNCRRRDAELCELAPDGRLLRCAVRPRFRHAHRAHARTHRAISSIPACQFYHRIRHARVADPRSTQVDCELKLTQTTPRSAVLG